MDELDRRLLEAWHTVSDGLKQGPWKLARRMERTQRKELRRPVRAWCVGLRASDPRIGAEELMDEGAVECCRRGYTHEVMLRGRRLRELCGAVRVPWPGVEVKEAARMLGRDVRTVHRWSEVGVLKYRKDPEPGRRGLPTRWVWSEGVIDPQADDGRGPWEVWGTLWQGLAQRVPEGFEQVVQRTPRLRDSAQDWRTAGQAWPGRYRGWDWLCPGRMLTTGQHQPCGRVCKKLWLPLPAWTIGAALGGRAGEVWEQMPRFESAQAGGSTTMRLACSRCWGLRFDCPKCRPEEAWNRFVSVVSGGLLYGREVEREGLGLA